MPALRGGGLANLPARQCQIGHHRGEARPQADGGLGLPAKETSAHSLAGRRKMGWMGQDLRPEGPDDLLALLPELVGGDFDAESGRTIGLPFDGNFHRESAGIRPVAGAER